jgi:hypothetical protein
MGPLPSSQACNRSRQRICRSNQMDCTRIQACRALLWQLGMPSRRRTLATAARVLARAPLFPSERLAEMFWTAFEFQPSRPLAGVAAPKLPALMQRGDQGPSHRIRLHLSCPPWLARCYAAAERNAPAQLQRDMNRRLRRA